MGNKKIKDIENEFKQDLLEQKINELINENTQLKLEVEKYKLLLTNSAPIVNLDPSGISPEQIIAETQLTLLKESSFQRQLTLEETKRVEIYHKILASKYLNQKKTTDPSITDQDSEDLLKLIQEGK